MRALVEKVEERPTGRRAIAPRRPVRARKQEVFEGFVATPARDQLRLVQQALSQLRESVVITTAELDKPGPEIVYVNPAFTRMTGWQPHELVGKNPRILQGPKTTRKTLDRLRAQLSKGEAFEGEDINYRKDGTPFHIDWYIEPLRDADGAINYWVAVQRDVTERNDLHEQLLRAQRLEGIGLLASGIAHDLNNVLAPVMIGCEVLREHVADPHAREFLTLLDDSAKRGAALVKQILSFARGISGAAALIDPRHIIHEIATMARATFPKTIQILEEVSPTLDLVEIDATQLHQLLLNLCVNARDAITESGTITLRAHETVLTETRQASRGQLNPGKYVVLEVEDTGSGIPPGVEAKIFDPFFSTKAPGKGTGLGLSTVVMIMEHQGGAVDLRTSSKEGTAFSLYLPAHEAMGRAERDDDNAPVADGRGRSVLVVDDEIAIGEIVRETLEGVGYKVTLAFDGIEAIAAAAKARPEIALVDLLMPRSGGPEVMRELRNSFPNIRLIAISGLDGDEVQKAAPEADLVLQKPFTIGELLRGVSEPIPA